MFLVTGGIREQAKIIKEKVIVKYVFPIKLPMAFYLLLISFGS